VSALTSLELFAGAGGLALGTARAGFHASAAVERDAACVETLRANGLPAVEADASAVDFSRWAGVDLVSGGPPCFAKGTLVLAREGYKPIEDIAVGDEVLTHLGRWRRVTAVMSRKGAALRRIKAQGVDVTTTDEHPFYARTMKWDRARRRRSFGSSQWITAAALTKDHFLAQILPEVEPDGRTPEFWWLIGRYLADGWRARIKSRPNSGRTVICCAHAEASELRRRIAAAGFRATPTAERTTVKFSTVANSLYRFLEPFGHLAHGKTLPGFALSLSRTKSAALLDGYMSGDGWAGPGFRRATTVSKRLAFGIALLAQRAGVVASVRRYVPKSRFITIEGRHVHRRPSWCVDVPQRNRSGFIDGPYGWKLVRKSERHGRGTVHNLSVEEDESYMADGAVVHNCQPWSTAGRHCGQLDARDMFPTLVRAVREARPRFVLVENVKGLLRPKFGEYLRYILAQLSTPSVSPDGESVASHMSRLSGSPPEYHVVHELLNAADFGAPQSRERVFILASRDGVPRMPTPTHSLRALLRDQWDPLGAYWERHGLPRPGERPAGMSGRIAAALTASDGLLPWRTVRDAISDIMGTAPPRPAKAYAGHTGSRLDAPSKTLKAGVHGVPGGENMVRAPDGNRHYTAREAARVQGFPDHWAFPHAWTTAMRQIGNAVPPPLAEAVARSLTMRSVL
jgi:DNA (cytosine-5)-methyltransferase 1